ncbi:TonB-dependent receptor [Niabella ginsengisoli]|uniref:TonB-dependent receptor n=1 Tax=Niabella ginsengisoli TaxID=522298 RepID=A0ABS9SKB7_9BACT|nr:TonB-dependent receptor plug domain-containing protein [Niabella ginsengisoli]MCH5598827.1 TonB-dependent receptor [Niabella ginsengisoli]
MKRTFMFSSLLSIVSASLFAQTDSTKTDSAQTLDPVEVRSTRLNEKSPFAISNIGKKEIAKQNLGQNFPNLLNQIPSVVISSDDGVGVGYSSMRIRGTDIARTNVTFNGIPVNDPESQGAFFVNFGDIASSTSSVQLQRGVGSSTNGAGAFGASLNIYNIEQSKEAFATISNAYGSFNTWKHTLQAGTGLLRGGFQFDARLSKINSSGYIQRSNSDLKSLQFIAGWTSKNEMTNIKFNLLSGKEKTGQAWNGIGTYFTSDDHPSSVDYAQQLDQIGRNTNTLGKMANGNYYNDQTDNYQQDYYQLFLNHKFNPYWSSNLSFFLTRGKGYYNEYKNGDFGEGEEIEDYGLSPVTIGDFIITHIQLTRQLWLDNHYYGTVFSANYNKNNTTLNFGGAFTKYDAKHYGFVKWAEVGIPLDYQWYHLTALKNDFNIYAKLQQQIITNLFGFVDLQLRNVDYVINGFRKNPDLKSGGNYTFFNPKAGLSYILKHTNTAQSKIYGSVAVANKEPNRDDFEANTDEAPKHEELTDFELGYQFNAKTFEAGVNGYYMKYKNQLIATGKINDVGAYARTNVGNSYRAGIELTAAFRPVSWLQANANATFSRNKIKNIIQYSDDYDNGGQIEETFSNTDISFSPNTIAGASLTFEPFTKPDTKQHFYIDLLEKYVGRQYLDNSQNKLRSINPYALTDARLRYQFSSTTFKDISLIFMVNNVFNKKYENNGYTFSYLSDGLVATENYYFTQAGTNWNVGLSFTF